jgi:SAM-dependent methyltransferase
MTALTCNVCQQSLSEPIYQAGSGAALSSLRRDMEGELAIYACRGCGHIQSSEPYDSKQYYDDDYDILTNSEEEDQIYAIQDGRRLFRAQHQADLFLSKVAPAQGARILDFGCAKSASMRLLQERRPDLAIHLFDVSSRYLGFWEKFLPPGHWATYTLPDEWYGSFDVLTSFFSLEHIAELAPTLATMHRLLRPGGLLYAIVPNTFTNISDLLVADHVNHFSATSLRRLLPANGFELLELDEQSHRGAFVVLASATDNADLTEKDSQDAQEVGTTVAAVERIAHFWRRAGAALASFEREQAGRAAVIYGAGFYGSYTVQQLREPQAVCAFVDQNPYLQGTTLADKPIIALDAIPDDVSTVYLAVNPLIADEVLAAVEQRFPNRFAFFRFAP